MTGRSLGGRTVAGWNRGGVPTVVMNDRASRRVAVRVQGPGERELGR